MNEGSGESDVGTERDTSADGPIRIVGFFVEQSAYQMVANWAACQGHELALIVTTPGPAHTDYDGHTAIVAAAPRSQDVLVTTTPKRAAAAIAAYRPDIVLSYTFPYRLPAAILAIPRLGAVNLHPSPLPRGRGPNPHRLLYDGAPTLGATLHRTTSGFDAGPILSRFEAPWPADADLTVAAVNAAWDGLLLRALDEGMAGVIAGEPGTPQADADVSYVASFTPEEHRLDWTWPVETLVRRTVALNLVEPRALATIGGAKVTVRSVQPLRGPAPTLSRPGTILARMASGFAIAVGDGAVEVETVPSDAVAVVPDHIVESVIRIVAD